MAVQRRYLVLSHPVAASLALALLATPLHQILAEPPASQPKTSDQAAVGDGSDALQPASIVQVIRGLSVSMREAGDALQKGEHTRGVDALNNARRAGEFVAKVTSGILGEIAAAGRDTVERARNALQNGDRDSASDILRRGSGALTAALDHLGSTAASGSSGARAGSIEELSGAQLINAKGVPIGMVSWFAANQKGDRQVGLRIGGLVGFAGFVNVGGAEVVVPISHIVLGRGKVALASEAGADELIAKARGGSGK